ncbi:MAG: CsbD family protein [Amphiplicatus sp.]
MNKQHVKGSMKETEGNLKKAAGKLTGDKRLEAEGHLDNAEGKARKGAGDVQDAAKKATKDRR